MRDAAEHDPFRTLTDPLLLCVFTHFRWKQNHTNNYYTIETSKFSTQTSLSSTHTNIGDS